MSTKGQVRYRYRYPYGQKPKGAKSGFTFHASRDFIARIDEARWLLRAPSRRALVTRALQEFMDQYGVPRTPRSVDEAGVTPRPPSAIDGSPAVQPGEPGRPKEELAS
jgi:hypothetical protein